MFALTNLYAEDLEDCPLCIETSDTLLKRFPDCKTMDQVLFNCIIAIIKTGKQQRQSRLKRNWQKNIQPQIYCYCKDRKKSDLIERRTEATKVYEGIYDQFIAGNFDEALDRKKPPTVSTETTTGRRNYYISKQYILQNNGKTLRRTCVGTNNVSLPRYSPGTKSGNIV